LCNLKLSTCHTLYNSSLTLSSTSIRSPIRVRVLAIVPAGSSTAERARQATGEMLRGSRSRQVITTSSLLSMKTTSIGKRMPMVWTCRHRGSMSPSPGFRPSRPIRPRRFWHALSARVASLARTSPRVALTIRLHEETLLTAFTFQAFQRLPQNHAAVTIGPGDKISGVSEAVV